MKSTLGVALIVAWFTVMVLAYAEPRASGSVDLPMTAAATGDVQAPELSDRPDRWLFEIDPAVVMAIANEPRAVQVGLVFDDRGALVVHHAGKPAVAIHSR